ncbi:MAG: cysteine rich repeat-containing protein [Hyphomicrobiales bacterium]|nr:cysteine rich repeat-containing protein [Hyphomicrobiales bacterium]
MLRILFVAAAVLGAASGAAHAQSLDSSAVMAACRSDYLTHCLGVVPGGGRIIQCLAENAAALAPECRRLVVLGEACVADIKRFCPDVPAQGGELASCIEKSSGQISVQCAQALKTVRPAPR